MKHTRTFLSWALGVASVTALTLTSACSTSRILGAQDHGAMPVTHVEILKSSNFIFWSSAEHVFLLCRDAGTDLICQRECGGPQELECPTSTVSDGIQSSNVR